MASIEDEHGSETGALQLAAVDRESGFRCSVCQRSFGRVEHLNRHGRSHRKERAFQCSLCRKGFYRVDALRRHEQVHSNPKGILPGKGARACTACSVARRRCTGGSCCSACQRRSIECMYPSGVSSSQSAASAVGVATMPLTAERDGAQIHLETTPSSNQVASPGNRSDSGPWPTDPDPSRISGYRLVTQSYELTPGETEFRDPESAGNHGQLQDGPNNPSAFVTGAPPSTFMPLMNVPVMDVDPDSGPPGPTQVQNNVGDTPILNDAQHQDNVEIERHDNWHQIDSMSINWLYDEFLPTYDMGQQPVDMSLFYQQSPRQLTDLGQVNTGYANQPEDVPNHEHSYSMSSYPNYNDSNERNNLPEPPERQEPDSSKSESRNYLTRKDPDTGHYYVDGDGARLPHVLNRRARRSSRSTSFSTPGSHMDTASRASTNFAFPENHVISASSPRRGISAHTYEEILKCFDQTCLNSSYFTSFETTSFPSRNILDSFLQSYLDCFQPIQPFIHPGTFDASKSHWLLILALAAIGSHYTDIAEAEIYETAMHEFLRRAIDSVLEHNNTTDIELLLSQVKLLAVIGILYSGDDSQLRTANRYHSDLVTFCHSRWSRRMADVEVNSSHDADRVMTEWKAWCERESVRRTGYCIWLLDCMRVFHFQLPALLSLEDANIALPCQEVLWEADTPLSWREIYSCSPARLSLPEAIQLVYVEKRLQPSMGEFSRILLIHALYRRTWEVEHYFRQPLAMWIPSANRKDDSSFEDPQDIWLPGIPTFAKWRNSACDCLDVLHWHANSVIGAASGMEHPTTLHLHVARVVLLTPFRDITKLALLAADENSPEAVVAGKHVRRWATEDHYKARLAMIHAGVLFWHVRRYSADGFYEPSSVFLATLALWAYGTFSKILPIANQRDESPSSDPDAELPFPSSIQLDRPADDELVQLFVKRGAGMKAKVLGVGNICSAKGPQRILVAGRKLLLDLKCWGISRQYVASLRQLEKRYGNQPS